MPSATPRLLPGTDIEPTVPMQNKLSADASPSSKAVVHFAIPVGDPGETTVSRVCQNTLSKMLTPNAHITQIAMTGKTQFGSGIPVTAHQLSTNVGVVIARRNPKTPNGSERIPTVGITQRQYAATHFQNGVGILGAHMHVNGAETRSTVLQCKRPTNLSEEDLAVMKERYPEHMLNLSPSEILTAHEPHKQMTPDPKTGAQRVGYVVPIADDNSADGPTPMHAFLTSRSSKDPALANTITIRGKEHAVYQEGDFHTIVSGLSANTELDHVARGGEIMVQIKNPEHSGISKGDAVAMITAELSTNGAGEPSTENGDESDAIPHDVEVQKALVDKLGGGYKNVFSPKDHIAVSAPVQVVAPAATSAADMGADEQNGHSEDEEEE